MGSRIAQATAGGGEWGSRNAPAFWGNRDVLEAGPAPRHDCLDMSRPHLSVWRPKPKAGSMPAFGFVRTEGRPRLNGEAHWLGSQSRLESVAQIGAGKLGSSSLT
ncbi:hypothetical protein BKP54_17060 [Ensifer sp. 1H6]|nr:hypothetical protein BKP54_17060 [Ensifer sp. 1H6]